jgi:hypothetical protein
MDALINGLKDRKLCKLRDRGIRGFVDDFNSFNTLKLLPALICCTPARSMSTPRQTLAALASASGVLCQHFAVDYNGLGNSARAMQCGTRSVQHMRVCACIRHSTVRRCCVPAVASGYWVTLQLTGEDASRHQELTLIAGSAHTLSHAQTVTNIHGVAVPIADVPGTASDSSSCNAFTFFHSTRSPTFLLVFVSSLPSVVPAVSPSIHLLSMLLLRHCFTEQA